jgi:phage anti-repressor protein
MYLHIHNLSRFEYRNYINGYSEFMRTENIVSISAAKKVAKKPRKSYGLTREKAKEISLNTRNAYMMKYPSTSEA